MALKRDMIRFSSLKGHCGCCDQKDYWMRWREETRRPGKGFCHHLEARKTRICTQSWQNRWRELVILERAGHTFWKYSQWHFLMGWKRGVKKRGVKGDSHYFPKQEKIRNDKNWNGEDSGRNKFLKAHKEQSLRCWTRCMSSGKRAGLGMQVCVCISCLVMSIELMMWYILLGAVLIFQLFLNGAPKLFCLFYNGENSRRTRVMKS